MTTGGCSPKGESTGGQALIGPIGRFATAWHSRSTVTRSDRRAGSERSPQAAVTRTQDLVREVVVGEPGEQLTQNGVVAGQHDCQLFVGLGIALRVGGDYGSEPSGSGR